MPVIYAPARAFMRVVFPLTLRVRLLGLDAANRPGGWLLACSHASHLDPFCLSAVLPRKIGWMARVEFYQSWWSARLMRAAHAFPVNRRGVPVRAMREALARIGRGEVVGVFPEGEVKTGADSVLRGAAIKRGICLLAQHSDRPVLPCVILGTEKLNAVEPWLPFRRGRLWIGCGEFVEPLPGARGRAGRAEMAGRIEEEMRKVYGRIRKEFALEDSVLP